jgi:hypothetical protein
MSFVEEMQGIIDTFSVDSQYSGIWEAVIYTRPGILTLNTSTGIYTQGSATTYAVQAILEDFDYREVDGSTIQPTDLRCGLPPSAVASIGALRITDTVTRSGVVYQIVRIMPDTITTWLHLRKAG